MGDAHTKRGRQNTGNHDANQRREVEKPQRVGRQVGGLDTVDKIADRSGDGDGETDGSRCADGMMDWDVAPNHEWHRKGSAADTDQAGYGTDEVSDGEHADIAGKRSGGFGFLVEKHLDCDVIEKQNEKAFQKSGGKACGNARSKKGADQNSDDDAFDHIPVNGSPSMMGQKTGHRREYNAGHGCAQCQMHDELRGYSLTAEGENQHRYDDEPAADTQQTGQNAGDGAYGDVGSKNPEHGRNIEYG